MSTAIAVRVPPGAKKLPDAKGWKNRFEIKSESSNRVYIVAQRMGSGEWACSCPGWIRYRFCKHLRTLGLLEASKDRKKLK